MALSPYDQSIYDAGFKYVPQSQYLLNPFQIPQGEESEGNVAPGLPAIYQAQNVGGGGGMVAFCACPLQPYWCVAYYCFALLLAFGQYLLPCLEYWLPVIHSPPLGLHWN